MVRFIKQTIKYNRAASNETFELLIHVIHCSDQPDVNFQIQSSLLPGQGQFNEPVRNPYCGDRLDRIAQPSFSGNFPSDESFSYAKPSTNNTYNVYSEQLSDDLPQLCSKPYKRSPMTPHRYHI